MASRIVTITELQLEQFTRFVRVVVALWMVVVVVVVVGEKVGVRRRVW